VAGTVLEELRSLNADSSPLGSFGAVVGATIAPPRESLVINGPLLVPGVGAQGGDVESVRRVFAGVLSTVLPSASRSLLRVGPDARALCEAARREAGAFAELVAG